MRKKIALLLAVIMTLSVTPITTFAASSNRLSRDTLIVPKSTLLYDATLGSKSFTGTIKTEGDSTISNFIPGTDLVMELKDKALVDDTFRIQLSNAEWFFGDKMGVASTADTAAATAYNTRIIKETAAYTYRYDSAGGGNGGKDAEYTIQIDSIDRASAVVRFTAEQAAGKEIRIPLMIYVKDEDVDAIATITENHSPVTTGSYLVASSKGGSTTTSALSIKSGRDVIALDRIVIRENRAGSLSADGAIELFAPSGYSFRDTFSTSKGITISSELGIKGIKKWHWAWTDKVDHTSVALYIETHGNSVGSLQGAIAISGLEIEPIDTFMVPPFGETLSMGLNNYEVAASWSEGYSSVSSSSLAAKKLNIKNETIPVAKAVDWTVAITAEEAKNLIAGRYPTGVSTDDKFKAAKVTLNEEEVGAWLSERNTTFTLPTGVKLMALKIETNTNLSANLPTGTIDLRTQPVSNTTRFSQGVITVNDNDLTIRGLVPNSKTSKSKLEFIMYLSVSPTFEGPVTLDVQGTSLPQGNAQLTIANVKPPIVMTSKSKDIQVGFQKYAVSDIVITETEAGAITGYEDLNIKIEDFSSRRDLLFQPITKDNYKVTSGDISLSLNTGKDGIISFRVNRASRTASTIELKDLNVKIDRSVPYGSYDVVAYGDSVFRNYGTDLSGTRVKPELVAFDRQDSGIVLPGYINVVTEGANSPTLKNVKITADSNVIVVDNKEVTLEVEPFIDPESNSFLVPLRFVANALGINESDVLWDAKNGRATIISQSNNRTIQFDSGSDVMIVNGARQTMETNGQIVKAKIKDDRMFIPFRYIGTALGISNERITWNDSTRTAEYNPVYVD